MNRIKVESGEYRISDTKLDQYLYTMNLHRDIAFTLYSKTLQKVALARNLNDQQCVKLFQEINTNNLMDDSLFELRLIGGDNSTKSEQYLEYLVRVLDAIDNKTNIICIVSSDLNDHAHPNSFEISCIDGTSDAVQENAFK